MEAIAVPAAVKDQQQIKAGEISFVYYQDKGSLLKNRVAFNQYAVSFVLNGQKEIYRQTERTILKPGQGMLIPAGNTIIAEHSLNDDAYSSLIVFFPVEVADNFVKKYVVNSTDAADAEDVPPFFHFANTPYLNEYLKGVRTLINTGQKLSPAIAQHKLEELLLVIYELFPTQMLALFNRDPMKVSLKLLVENNLFNNLTLDELAFLANRSRSSFKRDFEKAYNISPQKYIRERKLEVACAELEKGKQGTELYDAYGYDNLSNFNTAFKKKFGITPAAYRQNKTG